MKKITSLLLVTILLLASCAQEAMELTPEEAKGKELLVQFDTHVTPMNQIACGNSGTTTRSVATGTNDDNKIADIWVVQFDNSGNFMKKTYRKAIKGTTFDAPLGVNYSGTTSTVYFLANIGDKLAIPTSETNFKAMAKTITAEADLLSTDADTGKKCVPMMGTITGVVVPISGYLEKIDITLIHLLAKITVKYSNPTSANFVMENVQLFNVATTYGYQPPTAATTTATTDAPVINFPIEACTATTGTITFYVPENQRGDGGNTDASNIERWKIGQGVTKATYVQFTGHVGGINAGDKITYNFYPGSNNYNNYNLVRNTEYIMDITFTGASASDRRVTIPERSNCYMIPANGVVEIPVGRANESDLGRQLADNRTGWIASLLWSTGDKTIMATINATTMNKGYFTVTGADGDGNALVCIKDASGTILWSWHIWVYRTNNPIVQRKFGSLVWMDRNLGAKEGTATTVKDAGGLMYQWGRKDPFIGSDNLSDPVTNYNKAYDASGAEYTSSNKLSYGSVTSLSTISNDYVSQLTSSIAANALRISVTYPTAFITNWKGSTATYDLVVYNGWDSWGGGYRQPKSVYDPCPVGWRMPSGRLESSAFVGPLKTVTKTNLMSATRSATNYATLGGYTIYPGATAASQIYSATGTRDSSDGALKGVGVRTSTWFSNANTYTNYGYCVYINNISYTTGYSSENSDVKACALPVRCVRSDIP